MTVEGAAQLAGTRRREFRRFLVISSGAHVLLFAALGWTPYPSVVAPAGVISVDLVSAPASAPAVARPAPPRPPPKPVPKTVVLPKEPTARPSKPAKKEKPPELVEPKEQDLTDVLSQLRDEMGEDSAPEPPREAAAALPSGSPTGRPVSPEVAAWLRRAKIHVRRNWVVPPGFRTQSLETHVLVELDAGGSVVGTPRVTRRSGNPWYDEGVTRAIQKASPLPAPPEPGGWAFVFVPADSY